jgi:hypothetical protein
LVLIVLAVAPYLTGLHHAWVYDDHGVIVENEFLADPAAWSRLLTLDTVRDAQVVDGQRPVVVASYLLDRAAWGLAPAGFRVTNLLLHLFAVLLWFTLLIRIDEARTAGFAALLFAVHPLCVEAVVSPAFREDLLCLVFGLLYMHAWWSPQRSVARTASGGIALVFALLAKEAAVVFPFALAAGWWCFPATRPSRTVAVQRLVVSVVLVGGFLLMMLGGRPVQAMGGVWNGLSLRGTEGIWTAPWLAVSTLGRMLAPVSLSVDYVVTPVTGPGDPRLWIAGLVLGLALAVTIRYRRSPVVLMASAWMVVMFIPVSNVLPLYNPIADRYAYAILPGFAWLLVVTVQRLSPRAWIALVLVVAVNLGLTLVRIRDWKDDRTLWTAVLEVEPRSARAHTWLGLLEKNAGRPEVAWSYFLRAEELNPHDVTASVNRAILMGEAGDLAGAEALLRDVLARRPDHTIARRNLDTCLMHQGKPPEHPPGF